MSTTRLLTLARPYAHAAFDYAVQTKQLAEWDNMLAVAALVVNDKQASYLLNDPNVTTHKVISFFTSVLSSVLDEHKTNFIRVLAEKKRLLLLPEISQLFKKLRDEAENRIEAQAITAYELNDASKKLLVDKLTEKLKKKIELENIVDPNIIGGAIVRYGDEVIDGSLKGKLNRLFETLSA